MLPGILRSSALGEGVPSVPLEGGAGCDPLNLGFERLYGVNAETGSAMDVAAIACKPVKVWVIDPHVLNKLTKECMNEHVGHS